LFFWAEQTSPEHHPFSLENRILSPADDSIIVQSSLGSLKHTASIGQDAAQEGTRTTAG
jgi:hypothetical protein